MFLKKIMGLFSDVPDSKDRRSAYRVRIPGLRVTFPGKRGSFSVRDLSANGIAIGVVGRELAPGNTVRVNVFQNMNALLTNVMIHVVRLGKGFVGAEFKDLTEHQYNYLHEVTLEYQKKQAEMRKHGSEEDVQTAKKKGR